MRKWNGILFWLLGAYALGGAVSGVLLGEEWLKLENRGGIACWHMLLVGWILASAGVIIRLAVIYRAATDRIAGFFSTVSWATMFAGVAFSNAGFLGRWPEWIALRYLHGAFGFLSEGLCALAAVLCWRVGMKSEHLLFRFPAALFGIATLVVFGLSVIDLIVVNISRPWAGIAMALAVTPMALAALRIAFVIPSSKKETPCPKTLEMPS